MGTAKQKRIIIGDGYSTCRDLLPEHSEPNVKCLDGGVIYLVHDEGGQIEADITTIRTWEKRGELHGLALAHELAVEATAAARGDVR